ncbi:MAG TPA: type II secretion system protein [Candidatus Paceibacterota bacterium]|nr:type II secretion system protein [Candidatus Paceibacterota bacterium]
MWHKNQKTRSRGFTLIELLAVLGIAVLLAAGGIAALSHFRTARILDNQTEIFFSLFDQARTDTLASKNGENYGVHLATSSISLFRGTAFDTSTSTETTALPASLEIANISLAGGGSDVVFDRLTGTTKNAGTFTLRVVTDPTEKVVFEIATTGKVELQENE